VQALPALNNTTIAHIVVDDIYCLEQQLALGISGRGYESGPTRSRPGGIVAAALKQPLHPSRNNKNNSVTTAKGREKTIREELHDP